MKNLKIAILACGVLGVLSMFIPTHGFTLFKLFKFAGTGQVVIMMLAFAVPAIMGVMAMQKPPMQKWQAGVAAAGFALANVKLEIWKIFKDFGGLFKVFPMLLIVVAAIGGLVVSIMAVATDEK